MKTNFFFTLALGMILATSPTFLVAQEALTTAPETSTQTVEEPASDNTVDDIKKKAEEIGSNIQKQTEETARKIDQSKQAQEISAGVLQPIYQLAEYMSFSWFYWIGFMLMISGVVSYGLQLVLAKLVVLTRAGFDLKEIILDAQSLLISLVGLVLTTQAAAQNSTFTQSPAAVLSSTIVGAVLGFLFYLWGQTKELQALKGRKVEQIQESH